MVEYDMKKLSEIEEDVRAVFTWLSQNQNQSKYTSQPKGVVKPQPKPKPIPFNSQLKTALSAKCRGQSRYHPLWSA